MFSNDAERRIIECVRDYERKPRNSLPKARQPTITTPNRVVLTTSTIGPGSGATPGKGTATLQLFNGTSFQSLGVTVTIFNLTSSTIASGAYVQCVTLDGHLFYDVTSCENGS